MMLSTIQYLYWPLYNSEWYRFLFSQRMRAWTMRTALVRTPCPGVRTPGPAHSGTWAERRASTTPPPTPPVPPAPSTPVTPPPPNRCTTSPGGPASLPPSTSVPPRVCLPSPKLISSSWRHSHCLTSVTIVHPWWWAFSDRGPPVMVRVLQSYSSLKFRELFIWIHLIA